MITISDIYRGYDIVHVTDGGLPGEHYYVVKKDGVAVARCMSLDQAYAWVDTERRLKKRV